MPEYTENYGLTLPLKTENYDLDHMTDSMEIIDTELKRVDDKAQEVEQDLTQHKLDYATQIGTVANLTTTSKVVVSAVNELNTNKANKVQEDWITPTLLNGWVSDVPIVQYRKYNDGLVQLRGIAKAGVAGSVLFTLPVGYRPNGQHNFIGYTSGGQALIIIYADGSVIVNNYTNWVYLNQISFGI